MTRQQVAGFASFVAPAVYALALSVALPAGVVADEACSGCWYAGQAYSHGGCVQSVCAPLHGQQCLNGAWTGCGACNDPGGCPS